MAVDWDKATKEERRRLYTAASSLRKNLGHSWQSLLQEAFGTEAVAEGYEDNLRKGRVSAAKAYKLFLWIEKKDRAVAASIENDIAVLQASGWRLNAPASWETLLSKAAFQNVRVVKHDHDLNIVGFARGTPLDPADLKLLDEFYFEIDAPLPGEMIALQGHLDTWHAFPLSETCLSIEVEAGKTHAPIDENRQPFPVREETTPGRYSFIFILLAEQLAPDQWPIEASAQALPHKLLDALAVIILKAPETARAIVRTTLLIHKR